MRIYEELFIVRPDATDEEIDPSDRAIERSSSRSRAARSTKRKSGACAAGVSRAEVQRRPIHPAAVHSQAGSCERNRTPSACQRPGDQVLDGSHRREAEADRKAQEATRKARCAQAAEAGSRLPSPLLRRCRSEAAPHSGARRSGVPVHRPKQSRSSRQKGHARRINMAETRGGRPIAASQRPTGGDKAIATGKKQYFRRKKVCRFCVEKIDDINYKDMRLLTASFPSAARSRPAAFRASAPRTRSGLRSHQAGAQHRSAAVRGGDVGRRTRLMEVILREDIEKLGHRGSRRESSRRIRPQFPAAEEAGCGRHRVQQATLSSRNGKPGFARKPKLKPMLRIWRSCCRASR